MQREARAKGGLKLNMMGDTNWEDQRKEKTLATCTTRGIADPHRRKIKNPLLLETFLGVDHVMQKEAEIQLS